MLLMLHNSYILSLTNIISNLNSIIISRRQFVSGKDVIHGISGERVLHVFIFIFRIVQPIGADVSRQRSAKVTFDISGKCNKDGYILPVMIYFSAPPRLLLSSSTLGG